MGFGEVRRDGGWCLCGLRSVRSVVVGLVAIGGVLGWCFGLILVCG